jgi:hypothetical protein
MARKKLTEEEKVAKYKKDRLEQEFKDHMRHLFLYPEPTYLFNIGDKVAIGRLIDTTITEIHENGKFYKIRYNVEHNNYGKPYIEEGLERFVPWFDLRPFSNAKDSLIQNEDVYMNFSTTHIGDILSKAYHFGIEMNPDYQREYVWEESDKVALIDSIFNNIDIGKFCFIRNEYSDEKLYEVLDGKQRIRAILDFYENRFPYKGRYFNDLCVRDQNWFENYTITSAQIPNSNKKQVLKYFLMLNRSGRKMDEKQLEKVQKMYDSIEN